MATCRGQLAAAVSLSNRSWQKTIGVQHHYFHGNDKRNLYPCAASISIKLRAFVEVVERGSFTVAATELNLTQHAVTHQVQELERRFKVAPVERGR